MGAVRSRLRGLWTPKEGPLTSQDLAGIAKHLQECRHVIVLVGAGMSVSAGIPDFRTPGTGLYDNLQAYGLPYPQAIFELHYFKRNPQPFYTLCKEIWPGQFRPTAAHFFVTLLHQKGLLLRCYTQNIDSLETAAGLPKEQLVAAHGNFDSASCVSTGQAVPPAEVKEAVMAGEAGWQALRERHGGLVKPDIVFFGEALPGRFFQLTRQDFPKCDLLLTMGTSLQVQPFAGLVRQVESGVPRLLVNRERVGEDEGDLTFPRSFTPGFQFDEPNLRDVFFGGDCDQGVRELVELLGWQREFEALAQAPSNGEQTLECS